jgi:riboflavin biosynthesis pyrimidine reductase
VDNPRLTARIPGVVNQPMRVVHATRPLDLQGRHLADALIYQSSPPEILDDLFKRGVIGVLVEGGAHTLSEFAPFADRLELFLAPRILGDGLPWITLTPKEDPLQEPPAWQLVKTRRHEEDIQLTYRRHIPLDF